MKKLKFKLKRSTRTRWVYLSVGIVTVALAFLCVLFSSLLFDAAEEALYNDEHYTAINIVSSGTIGEPLEYSTRLELFDQCEIEGDSRLALPAEITMEEAEAIAYELWQQALLELSSEGGELASGDLVSDLLNRGKVTAVLRDFYNRTSEAKLAMWCVQVYCDSSAESETYCLSLQLDSRTGEPYSLSMAAFSNVLSEHNSTGIESFCSAIGADVDATGATVENRDDGAVLRITLSNGMVVQKTCYYGSHYEIIAINPY